MNNANTPASPLTGDAYVDFEGHINASAGYNPECQGLTKREHFAGLAMQGLLSNSGGPIQGNPMSGFGFCNCDDADIAGLSVQMADALLKELDKAKSK